MEKCPKCGKMKYGPGPFYDQFRWIGCYDCGYGFKNYGQKNMSKPQIFKVTRTPKDKNCIAKVELTTLLDSYCAVINVSDSECATFDLQHIGLPSFWFPINEIGMWGHGPFLGALRVVNEYYKGDKPVLIHCHAGANRSPSVAYAVLLAKGYTPSEIEESLEYENLTQVFDRNVLRKHIPSNIVQFLKIADENKTYSIHGVLRGMDALYDEFARKKFDEQNNYVVKTDGPNDETRLVYNREKKRFILQKTKEDPTSRNALEKKYGEIF